MFTPEEASVIYNLLSRVTIQGNEAANIVFLQEKLKKMINVETKKEEKK